MINIMIAKLLSLALLIIETIFAVMREVIDEFILEEEGLLSTGRHLDREKYQRYIIQIRACDQGSPVRYGC